MSWILKVRRRARLLLRRPRVEAEMRDEIAFHVDQEAAALTRSGATPEEARRAALIAFGGVERFKEEGRDGRGGRWLDDLLQDLAYATRQMVRSPLTTVAIVGILGIGVSGSGLAFSVVRAYLQRPLPVPHADRIAYLIPAASRDAFATVPDLRGVDWKSAAKLFESTASWDLDGFTLVNATSPDYVNGAWVSSGYFELLGAHAIRGRLFAENEYVAGSRVALISQELWSGRFGGADSAVGSVLRVHSTDRPREEEMVTVVGVLGPQAWRVNGFQDLLRPLGEPRMFSLARLAAGMSFDASARRLTAAVRDQVTVPDSSWRMSLVSAQDEHVYRVRPTLRALFGIALLLLLLSVSSVGALIVARGGEREQELAVRRALGASSERLTRQLSAEAGLLWLMAASVGIAVTVFIAPNAARAVESMGGVSVPAGLASVHVDAAIVVFIVVASLVPFALLGLAPLLRGLVSGAAAALPGARITAARPAAIARRALVIVQVTLAVTLLTNASLLVQSVRGMADAALGFDSENLLKAHLLLPRTRYPDSASQVRAMATLLSRVAAVPGVSSATAIHPHPFRGTSVSDIECDGCAAGSGSALRATPQTIAPNYFATLGIPLAAGRAFGDRDDGSSPLVAIVSGTLAHQLGGVQEALGRRVRVRARTSGGAWLTVIGVVGDVRKTFGDTLYPDLYVPFAQNPRAYFALLARTANAPQLSTTGIRRAVAAEDATLALSDVEAMDDVLRARRGPQLILASFAGGAAALALALTTCALYAVVAYLTIRRRREFAVRLALGAGAGSIAGLVARDGARLLAVGSVAGVAVAAASAAVLRSQLFGVTALDGGTYVSAVLAVAAITGAAITVPALRAAWRSPAQVLREDG